MKICCTTLIVLLSLLCHNIAYAQAPICEVDNEAEAVPFRLHPKLQQKYNQRSPNATWSVQSPYGGCPDNCDPNDGFDCCPITPCSNFEVPVVITLLQDGACGNNAMTIANIDAFMTKMNDYYACANMPITLFKCTNWDDSSIDYMGNPNSTLSDGSTRAICNNDYNLFYRSSGNDMPPNDPAGNGVDDFQEVKPFNIPNVLNIYIPGNYNGFTGQGFTSEGGVASFPSTNLSSYATAFGIDGLNNSIDDCTDMASGSATAIHELGHWFGLYHTHGAVNNYQVNMGDPNGNFWAECPDGSECCTSGDFICDTDPDPNIRPSNDVTDSSGNAIANCVSYPSNCNPDASSCFSTCAASYPMTTNADNNIMSYSFCRYEFTECQKTKMLDALLCARSNLICCDPDFADTDQAAPYVVEEEIVICVGDAIPTFTINDATGGAANPDLNTTCIGWYASANNVLDFNELGTGLTFTPAVSSAIPGTYTFYFDDDLNNYSITPCDDDVRKAVTLIVTEQAQAITNMDGCISGTESLDFSYSSSLSDNCQILGYYFSDGNPSTLSPTTTINNAINGSAPLNLANGNIIQANAGMPMTDLSALSIDCDALNAAGGDGSYFLTPFITQCEDDFMCSGSGSGTPTIWNFDPQLGGGSSGTIQYSSCTPPAGYQLESCMITVTVTQYSGNTSGTINFDVRDISSCGFISSGGDISQNVSSVPFTFTIPKSIIDGQMDDNDFNETTDAFCLNAVDIGGDDGVRISYTVDLSATYAGRDAQTLWNANGMPTIVDSDCFWGTPFEIVCTDLASNNVLADCQDNSGTIALNITGGTAPYSITNDSGANITPTAGLTGSQNVTATTMTAGNYNITVEDAAGCESTFTVNLTAACAMPVELMAFTGEHHNGMNYLNWSTATELNNDHFVLERSEDGLKFEPLAKVQGAGTTVEAQYYDFIDIAPKLGINYYRLKQVDLDGVFEYSNVISIDSNTDKFVTKVYPSPTSTFLNVEANEVVNQVEIIDLTGRTVLLSTFEDANQLRLDVSSLSIGTYFVSIVSDEATKLVRFVKN